MSEENQRNTNNGQYDGEQLYWYLAQDGRYYDQYGRPWMGDQQQYQNDEGYNGWSDSSQQYSQEYNQGNFEGYGSQEQSQEQIDENADENTGYGYDSSNAEWKRNSNELENNTYGQNYEQDNQQLNQPNQPNESQEYPYDFQQSLQQEYPQDYSQNYQQEYSQGYNYQGYDQEPCQQYNQGYENTNDGTQTYEKETDSLEQTYSYQNDNFYGNVYPEQGGWP